MHIDCKQCGATISADDINLDRMVAKCAVCHSVFSFADAFENGYSSYSIQRIDVPMPKGFEVDNFGGELTITRRWFSAKFIFLTVFAVIWNGFMLFWYGIAISQQIWLMAAFGLLHVGVGLWLIYYVLAGYLNKTTIRVNMQDLTIKHGPLPYPGNKWLNHADIEQLYCKEQYHRGKNSSHYTYQVHGVTKAGKHEKLLAGLDNSEQALYLEQEIERFLGIKDRPVKGEIGR